MNLDDDDTQALILAYVYGELSASARASFEAQLEADPDLRAEVDGLMATRDMLDVDLRYGADSGLDEPPAHLRESIFRAESIARPRELTEAAAVMGRPHAESSSWLHKVSTWLIGGAVVAGSAAALFALVVVDGSAEPLDALSAPGAASADESEGADDAVAKAPLPEMAKAKAGKRRRARRNKDTDGFAGDDDDAFGRGAGEQQPSQGAQLEEAARQPGKAAPPSLASGLRNQERDDLDAPASIDAFGAGGGGKGSSSVSVTLADEVGAEGRALAQAEPEPARDGEKSEAARPAEDARADKKASGKKVDRKPKRKKGISAKSRSSGRTTRSSGPPPLPSDVTEGKRQMTKFRQKALENEKELSRKARSLKTKRDAESVANQAATSDSLTVANRELSLGRPQSALLAYEKAEKEDRTGRFGVLPLIGQMRSWQKLGRPDKVLELFERLRTTPATDETAVEGYRIAAKAAETQGSLDEASTIWAMIERNKKNRTEARKQLKRLTNARNMRASEAAAAEADEEPQQAAPEQRKAKRNKRR